MKEKEPLLSEKKILAISQHCFPEPFPVPAVFAGLAEHGHQIHVLAELPNYPEGKIYPGYEHGRKRDEMLGNIRISRVSAIPRGSSLLFRLLNYYSFVTASCFRVLFLKPDYDCVLVWQSSPVMMAYAGILYSFLNRKPLILYCMDLWPASLKAGGIREQSWIWKHFRNTAAWIYRRADRILISSERFRTVLTEDFGISPERIRYVPQCACCEKEVRKEPHETMNLLYAGNIGMAQNIGLIADCAAEIRRLGISDHGRKILFHIIGSGSCARMLAERKKTEELDHMNLYGRKTPEEVTQIAETADAGILTLNPDTEIADVIPAKYQTYLSAGLPVLTNERTAVSALAEKNRTGISAETLTDCLLMYLGENREQMSEQCRNTYLRDYSLERLTGVLEEEIQAAEAGR